MPHSQSQPVQCPPVEQRGPASVAVVLVAGIGQRLHPLTEKCPKALVPVAGETMLARTVRQLASHGVCRVVLATGFEEHSVKVAMKELLEGTSGSLPLNLAVQYCFNPNYRTTQNSVSLAACKSAVDGQDFYKIDGDLLFTEQVLQRLDACGAELSVAVDTRAKLGQEEMKVQLFGATDRTSDADEVSRRIVAFGKGLDPAMCAGESIGLERVSGNAVKMLFEALDEAAEKKRTTLYYEDIYSELLQSEKAFEAVAVDVSDLPWTEIDTHEDLKAAEAMVQQEPWTPWRRKSSKT